MRLRAVRFGSGSRNVPDNPGDWMLHCHVLAHLAGGMTGTIRVK